MIYYEQSNDETIADSSVACICRADGARGRVRCDDDGLADIRSYRGSWLFGCPFDRIDTIYRIEKFEKSC